MKANYPRLMKDITRSPDLSEFEMYSSEGEYIGFNYKRFVDKKFKELVQKKMVTQKFATEMKKISKSGNDYEAIINRLNEFSSNNKLSDIEIYLINVFKSTLEASNKLWSEYDNQATRRLKCSTWVILGDGAATLLGCAYSGPFGIIQGSLVSAALNEDC